MFYFDMYNSMFNYLSPFGGLFSYGMPQYSISPMNPFGGLFINSNYFNTIQSNSIFSTRREYNTTYNKAKAEELLKNAKRGLPAVNPVPPMCAKYVKKAIINSGLGEYVYGNGEETKYMLRNNLNFKEINVRNTEHLKNLPKGTVVVYDANTPVKYSDGSSGYIGTNGHVGFKYNKNTLISDRMEEMPLTKRAYAFIPV